MLSTSVDGGCSNPTGLAFLGRGCLHILFSLHPPLNPDFLEIQECFSESGSGVGAGAPAMLSSGGGLVPKYPAAGFRPSCSSKSRRLRSCCSSWMASSALDHNQSVVRRWLSSRASLAFNDLWGHYSMMLKFVDKMVKQRFAVAAKSSTGIV